MTPEQGAELQASMMRDHLQKMQGLSDAGVASNQKWNDATAVLVERFLDVGDRITPVIIPEARPLPDPTKIA